MKTIDLNLSALQYFIDTIDLGSLTAAARKNHVSRPAVSQAIRRTEQVIGFELISHQKNRLSITVRGRSFYQNAKKALALFDQSLVSQREEPAPLRLACSATLAEFLILPLLQKLKVETRSIEIHIGTTPRVRQLISDGEARLGFFIDDDQTFALKTESLHRGRFVVRSRTGKMQEPFVSTESRPEVLKALKALEVAGRPPQSHTRIASWAICKKMAETLDGSCLLPDLIPKGGQKDVRDVDFHARYEVVVAYKDKNTLSEAEVALLALASSLFG